MTHLPINHDTTPIRLFKSDFLEFFTHIHPAVVVILYLPLVFLFLGSEIMAVSTRGGGWAHIPAGFLLGLFVWTFTEYIMHRFVFHYRPRSPFQEKVVYLFHGVHHHQPQCKTRLVMPPPVNIPLAAFFYFLILGITGPLLHVEPWFHPIMAGFTVGYLTYDITHYATHHFPMRSGVLKYLKRYHMMHHYKTPDARYGVSSPLWDVVFGTKPAA